MEYVLEPLIPKVFRDADAINDLKYKVINQFTNLLCKVSKGYKPDYENILQEISLISLVEDGYMNVDDSLFIIQYYLNNE